MSCTGTLQNPGRRGHCIFSFMRYPRTNERATDIKRTCCIDSIGDYCMNDEFYLARTERVADAERLALSPGSVVHSGLPPGRVADRVVLCGRRHDGDGDEEDNGQKQAARSASHVLLARCWRNVEADDTKTVVE